MTGDKCWGNVVEKLECTLITPKGSVEVVQYMDYENAKVSVTVPSYAYVHLHGHLNEIGDELTIKMKHVLESKSPELVEDFSLFVRLNQSDVVYTNLSWNPEVIAELLDISTGALNSTINFTMTLVNQTRTRYQALKHETRERYIALSATLSKILENP
ncbi:hypothetical protein, partial [Salmonella sp. s54395]|uniref:hypothetical protein n=1 Tax=Salmonella sp. s54395 TaxID=3159664 RepID=UPI003980977F